MHQFFQQFNVQQRPQAQINMTPELQHNLMVMEICANWPFVGWLMCRYREGWLKKMDPMENDWFNFINTHNINIENYKNGDDFMEKNLKPLNK